MYLVRIEPKRVQTFLFEVSRLRAMVGANVLLGEFMRFVLVSAYQRFNNNPKVHVPSVQPLREDVLSDAINDWKASSAFETSIAHRFGKGFSEWLEDRPADAFKHGVLAREGGHFIALFKELEVAKQFCSEAKDLASKFVPRVQLACSVLKGHERRDSAISWEVVDDAASAQLVELHDFDLPVFQRCPELPSIPADDETEIWEAGTLRTRAVSFPVALRYRYGKHYVRHERIPAKEQAEPTDESQYSLDIASLLRPQTPMWSSGCATLPPDFDALAGGGYMAVVHIDGNGIGARSKGLRMKSDQATSFADWRGAQFEIETFFHGVRVTLRNALVKALGEVFTDETANYDGVNRIRPYQLMMVGGDDILLVCRADLALPFVVHFAKALKDDAAESKASRDDTLTIGAGVVISKPSLPFYRLHSLAESLASSAKALFRSRVKHSKSPASVVDWVVVSDTWTDNIAASRTQGSLVDDGCGNRLCLSGKPYVILNDGSQCNIATREDCSLEVLSEQAGFVLSKNSQSDRAARGQLRSLESEFQRGKTIGEIAWLTLPSGTKSVLKTIGYDASTPWHCTKDADGTRICTTTVLDLVELTEIDQLARQTRWPKARIVRDGDSA